MIKQFIKYVSQSVIGMIGISIYILADTYFISINSGANGLAVLNLILPIYGLMFALGSMIGIGSATEYSLKRASGRKTDYCFSQSLIWTIIISLIFVISGVFMPEKILGVMGADAQLIRLGTPYLRTILIAAPFFMINYTFTAFVRNDEAPAVVMVASISGSLFNIIFDYVFMFPAGLGFEGAALATSISPIVTSTICFSHFYSKNNNIRFRLKKPIFKYLLSAVKLGTPAFVGEITAAVTTLTFNILILNIAGNTGVAAYGVIANIALVIIAIFNGISQGIQPLISKNYGAENEKAANWFLKVGIIISLCIMVIELIGVFVGTDSLISIFNHEGNMELHNYVYNGIRLYFLGFIFASVNIILVTYFAATERSTPAIIGSIMRGLVGIIICAIILSKILGLTGIWMSFLASELIAFVVIITMFIKIKRTNRVNL